MKEVMSCGILLFRKKTHKQFLIMQHASRWDLPKGHVDPGETKRECALREFTEETGIDAESIKLIKGFRSTARKMGPMKAVKEVLDWDYPHATKSSPTTTAA